MDMWGPTTKDEWWQLVDDDWENLSAIFDRVGMDTWDAEVYKARRDPRLHPILEEVWARAPDKPHIHEWPGWGVLCDLCSESYVLYPEPAVAPAPPEEPKP